MIFHLGPSFFQGYMQNQTGTNRFEGSPKERHTTSIYRRNAWLLPFFGAQNFSPTGHAPLPRTVRIFHIPQIFQLRRLTLLLLSRLLQDSPKQRYQSTLSLICMYIALPGILKHNGHAWSKSQGMGARNHLKSTTSTMRPLLKYSIFQSIFYLLAT